jgi:hypothetical protein
MESTMSDQNRNGDKKEMRAMWIMTAAIVLAIMGMMGLNMLTHPDWMHGYTSSETTTPAAK